MTISRAGTLIRSGELPVAAQRAAATTPALAAELSMMPGPLDADVWVDVYSKALPADVAERFVQVVGDPRCVRHLLDSGERRAAPLEAVLKRWRLDPDSQMTLASRRVPAAVADNIVSSLNFTDEAKAAVARHANASVLVEWGAKARDYLDAPVLELMLTAYDRARPDECVSSHAVANAVAEAVWRHPELRNVLYASDTMMASAALSLLGPLEGEGTDATAAHFERLVAAATADVTMSSHIALNLLERPDTPIEVKLDVWSALGVPERADALSWSVADPHQRSVSDVAPRDVEDPADVEWLLLGGDNRTLGSKLWVWVELADNPHLDDALLALLRQRLHAAAVWKKWGPALETIPRIEDRLGAPHCAEVLSHLQELRLAAERVADVSALTEPSMVAAPWPRRYRGSEARSYVSNPASIPVAPQSGTTATAADFWGRRPDQAAAYLAATVGEHQSRWELLFALCESWDGTVGELVDAVLAVDVTP